MKCPCCRQELPNGPGINVDLLSNYATARGRAVLLTPDQAIVLHTLLNVWPASATKKEIMDAMWGRGTRPTDPGGIMRTQVYRLKRRLVPLEYEVVNVLSFGYRIAPIGAYPHAVNLSENSATILRQ